jgi:hypothetical protein
MRNIQNSVKNGRCCGEAFGRAAREFVKLRTHRLLTAEETAFARAYSKIGAK